MYREFVEQFALTGELPLYPDPVVRAELRDTTTDQPRCGVEAPRIAVGTGPVWNCTRYLEHAGEHVATTDPDGRYIAAWTDADQRPADRPRSSWAPV